MAKTATARTYKVIIKWIAVSALAIGAAATGILFLRPGGATPDIPTTKVIRGEFVDYLELRGQVKASQSSLVTAPFSAGDLQIVRIAPSGKLLEKGDVVVQFDDSVIRRTVKQLQSDLKQANADIQRTAAQARLQEEKIQTELTEARYAVERARLDVSTEEVVSAIDAGKNRLALDSAERKLRSIESKMEAQRVIASAEMESKRQKRDKVQFDIDMAERNISALTVTAPVSGMVNLLPNPRAAGPIVSSGSNAPEFKAGDRAWPGAAIAELPDLSAIRISTRADEIARSRLELGQEAVILVDAVPDREHRGKIESLSALTKIDYSSWPPKNNFDVILGVENPDSRLRPGLSATVRIAVERIPDGLTIPAEAAFQKAGRHVAYAWTGRGFVERFIHIGRTSGGRLLISSGLEVNEIVALRDPYLEEKGKVK